MAIQAQIIMELCWIVPWFRALTRATNFAGTWRVFVTFFIFLEVIFWFSRILNYFQVRIIIRRIVLSLILLALCLAGLRYLLYFLEPITLINLFQRPVRAFGDLLILIPDEFVIIVAILFLGFRGISIAGQKVSPTDMLWRFQFGIAMYILYILLNTLITGEIPGNQLFLFIFLGLVAIGSARMAVLEKLRGGRSLPFDRKWLFGLLFSTLIFVGAAFFIAQLTSQPVFPVIIQFISAIAVLLLAILMILLMPIFLLIIRGLIWLITNIQDSSIFPEFTRNVQEALDNLSNMMERLILMAQNYVPDISAAKPYILWGGIILILGAGLIFIGLRWLTSNFENKKPEEVESLFEGGNIIDYLRYLLRQNLVNIGRSLNLRMSALTLNKKQAAIRIRQIYQELINLCEEIGIHRTESQTPLEFKAVLEKTFPENIDAVNRITRAYIKVRYGELPENQAEMDEIEEDWKQIQHEGKLLSKKQG